MVALILGCEIAFWVVIVAGLATRYLLGRRRLGLALLALTPVVDLVLLSAAGIDLHRGAPAEFAHGLAAIYLGFSLAYGHRMISWADTRFAHRFAGGPAPVKLYGAAYARACWFDLARTGLAALIGAAVLELLRVVATGPTEALGAAFSAFGILLAIDALWAVSYTLWPRREPDHRSIGHNRPGARHADARF